MVVKLLRTYSGGEVGRSSQPAVAGQAEPEHPAPPLTLAPADESVGPQGFGQALNSSDAEPVLTTPEVERKVAVPTSL